MKRLLALTPLAIAAALVLAVPDSARAQATNTSTLTVTATVVASCRIDNATLDFLTYDGTETDASTPITITCNTATPHWVGIDNGTSGTRQMLNAALDPLNYQLYRDAGRTVVWDNVDPGPGPYTVNAAGSTPTVFGRIPGNQIVPVGGPYSQDLTMTVNF